MTTPHVVETHRHGQTSDSEAQQSWWDSLSPEQQEAHEDGIARRKAEREARESGRL
jgi:hypothetical protein